MQSTDKNTPFEIGGVTVKPGESRTIDIPLASLVTNTTMEMTARVICGKKAGPTLFISAAIHGDEINGVEIIRRVLRQKQMKKLQGTVVAIPIVNVHGFTNYARYLPDGRDLNRSFPGSSKGSLAGRMADTFLREVVAKCTHGIDLHTGARHRENLPQIRADLSSDVVRGMAASFGVPVVLDAKIRDGSLRQAAGDEGIPVLLYEAGEALRFNEVCIRAGMKGCLQVMRHIGMLPAARRSRASQREKHTVFTDNTGWIRAPNSGILRSLVAMGATARKDSVLGVIADPLGDSEYPVYAPKDGIVIGKTNMPLAHEGEALFHLAYYDDDVDTVRDQVETLQEHLEPEQPREAPYQLDDEEPIV